MGLRDPSYCWACRFILFYVSDTVTLTAQHLSTKMFIILARILSSLVRFAYVERLSDQRYGCKCTICHSLMKSKTNLSWLIPVWLFAFSLLIYLSGWLNATMMFLLRRHISFSWIPLSVLCCFVCLTLIFPNSFCLCLGLSLVIFSSHITSVTYFRESTKTECTNISLIISDSYNHSLWTRTALSQNYKVEKQRSNAADFVDTTPPSSLDNQFLELKADYYGGISDSILPCQYVCPFEEHSLLFISERRDIWRTYT